MTDEYGRNIFAYLECTLRHCLAKWHIACYRRKHRGSPNFQHLLKCGESLSNVQLFPIHFLTPTTFKQDKRYVIFPQESLILQSLISRWNVSFPEAPMDDEDAFQALLRGIHIVDYNLHTTR